MAGKDPLADAVLARIFGPQKAAPMPETTSDEEILAKFEADSDSVSVEDAAQALFRRLRRAL